MATTADTLTAAFAAHGWTQRTDGSWSRPTAHGDQQIFAYWSVRGAITQAARMGSVDRHAVSELGPRVPNKLARLVEWITEPVSLAPFGGGLEVIRLRDAAAARRSMV